MAPSPPLATNPVASSRSLAPEDAYYRSHVSRSAAAGASGDRTRSTSRRHKGNNYKKLLWFKQPFPDNYTDEETFLDHLQRNPRLQPYQFWSLMADLTIIVQHIASVAIFCCCFVEIHQDRVSPVAVVSWASFLAVLGWILWDYWMGQEEAQAAEDAAKPKVPPTGDTSDADISTVESPNPEPETVTAQFDSPGYQPPYVDPTSSLSPRNQQRLATVKSALLIYAALLGLSPILKSLTKSTTSDSIWALSTWLLCMNVAFFDYGTGTGARWVSTRNGVLNINQRSSLPASISTNSAMMASTVLASRLPSTTHVFSLTLFSIEVFGLFPIFRRYLRVKSWNGHLTLTILLIVAACGGVFVTLTGGGVGAWVAGVIIGGLLVFLAMGICSWWLIGLQKYKNEIHGPWDPARPTINRRFD